MELRSNNVSVVICGLVLALSAVLAACVTPVLEPQLLPTPVDTPSPPTTNDLSVILNIREPITLNQAIPVTITVESTRDIAHAYVNFYLYGPDLTTGNRQTQEVALRAHQTLEILKQVVFTQQGPYDLIASVFLPVGLSVADSKRVDITTEGGVVNPVNTYGPSPVEVVGQPSPEPTPTPFHGSAPEGRSNS